MNNADTYNMEMWPKVEEYTSWYFRAPTGQVTNTGSWQNPYPPEQFESVVRLRTGNYTDSFTITSGKYTGYEAWPDQKYKVTAMQNEGYALWCKAGAHSFDPADKGRKRMQFTDYEGEVPEDVIAWTCSEHTPDMLRRKEAEKPKAVTARPTADDIKADREMYTEYLEWRNGQRDEPTR